MDKIVLPSSQRAASVTLSLSELSCVVVCLSDYFALTEQLVPDAAVRLIDRLSRQLASLACDIVESANPENVPF